MVMLIGCGTTAAQSAAFLGTRCSADETLHIREDGLGFNENTICDWVTGPTYETLSFYGQIDCRNVYVLDATTTPVTTNEVDAGAFDMRVVMLNDTDVEVFLDGASTGRFGTCA